MAGPGTARSFYIEYLCDLPLHLKPAIMSLSQNFWLYSHQKNSIEANYSRAMHESETKQSVNFPFQNEHACFSFKSPPSPWTGKSYLQTTSVANHPLHNDGRYRVCSPTGHPPTWQLQVQQGKCFCVLCELLAHSISWLLRQDAW